MDRFTAASVAHVDLGQPLERLAGDAAYVCFWHSGIPLGHAVLSKADRPASKERLRTLAAEAILPAVAHYRARFGLEYDAPLSRLAQAALPRRSDGARESVSVVICTRDRAESLRRCLESLGELSERPLEVVVVDNAPKTDATKRVVAEFPAVRYVLESRPGLSRARNAGIAATTGSIVAFTDDDVVVDREWLTRIVDAFEGKSEVLSVTGLVLPAELESPAQVAFEQNFGLHRGYIPRTFNRPRTDVWCIGAGANMAVRRQAFAMVGTFDERLGAGAAGCSEDTEFWHRILDRGFACEYTPQAVVHHFHRADDAALASQLRAYMRGHVAALLIQFQRSGRLDNLRRIAFVLPVAYFRQFVRGLVMRSEVDRGVWSNCVRGFLSGLAYLVPGRLGAAGARTPQRISE